MTISVINAEKKLKEAHTEALKTPAVTCSHSKFIDEILDNTHLTFKYILFTAILSKATDSAINPLALQAKSTLPGAYDARTICHKVIVPFEISTLNKALGGSNEPFLNKPARFTELSKTNAVRKGRDQTLLNSLCDNLPNINQNEAFICLVYIIQKLLIIKSQKEKLLKIQVDNSKNNTIQFIKTINQLLAQSYEGEVLTLIVAGLYTLLYNQNPNIVVEVHPVNQSGASSKEVSDLDIYDSGKLIIANELKDKIYNEYDIRHAMDKVITAGGNKMFFIEGPRASYKSETDIAEIVSEYASSGYLLTVISYNEFINFVINLTPNIDFQQFMKYCILTAQDTKFKEDTVKHFISEAN